MICNVNFMNCNLHNQFLWLADPLSTLRRVTQYTCTHALLCPRHPCHLPPSLKVKLPFVVIARSPCKRADPLLSQNPPLFLRAYRVASSVPCCAMRSTLSQAATYPAACLPLTLPSTPVYCNQCNANKTKRGPTQAILPFSTGPKLLTPTFEMPLAAINAPPLLSL